MKTEKTTTEFDCLGAEKTGYGIHGFARFKAVYNAATQTYSVKLWIGKGNTPSKQTLQMIGALITVNGEVYANYDAELGIEALQALATE